jgi:sugar lactone lactonase YvrE
MTQSIKPILLSAFLACFSLDAAPYLETVAGTGKTEANAQSGPVVDFNISNPFGVEFGPDGRLYVTEVGNHRIIAVNMDKGQATTFVGTGKKGYSGDGGQATKADLNEPYEIRFDSQGNTYFVEMMNNIIRKVGKDGKIQTIAGTGEKGYSGDGGPATKATFNRPHSIALDEAKGHLYVADIGNHRIRRIDLNTGVISGFAGNGGKQLPKDGQEASPEVPMIGPRALYIQGRNLWVALREGHSVWKINLDTRKITHIAGTGNSGYSGDGGDPKLGTFNGPKGIVVDAKEENVYVVDTENQALRRIDLVHNQLSSHAGYGPKGKGYLGDKTPADKAKFGRPHGICLGPDGLVYTGDTLNHRVRRVVLGNK